MIEKYLNMFKSCHKFIQNIFSRNLIILVVKSILHIHLSLRPKDIEIFMLVKKSEML